MKSWSSRKKKESILYRLFCPKEIFFNMFYPNVYSVLNTLSQHTYFYISKNITSYFFLLVSKIVERQHCILKNNKNSEASFYKRIFFSRSYLKVFLCGVSDGGGRTKNERTFPRYFLIRVREVVVEAPTLHSLWWWIGRVEEEVPSLGRF